MQMQHHGGPHFVVDRCHYWNQIQSTGPNQKKPKNIHKRLPNQIRTILLLSLHLELKCLKIVLS